jgi:uncharacterized protein (DUF2141 family)
MRLTSIKTLTGALSIIAVAALAGPAPAGAQSAPPQAGTARLVVTFAGLESAKGALMVAMFDGQGAYAGQGAPVRATRATAGLPSVRVEFDGLAPGRYAIKAFHDLAGDGKLHTNPFGIPTEPYAFSNGARGVMGPPSWDESAFVVGPGLNVQTISIR